MNGTGLRNWIPATDPRHAARGLVMLGCLLLLGACAQIPRRDVVEAPTSVPPQRPIPAPTNGAIFNSAYAKPLFEDSRPRYVGDLLTVLLRENLSANKDSGINASREGSAGLALTLTPEILGDLLKGQDFDISGDTGFSGQGGANASYEFTGEITVTVIDVLPNGNLKVAGEKRISINKGVEYILFSGIVDPDMINANGTIRSTRVANVRLEYYGKGFISEAQSMGWLQRLLLNISPF